MFAKARSIQLNLLMHKFNFDIGKHKKDPTLSC